MEQEDMMTSKKDLIHIEYEGGIVSFSERGWFNATIVAEKFGKRPNDWLTLDETRAYIEALNTISAGILTGSQLGESHFVKTRRGKNGGTWLHPKLAIPFARWLDIRFAVWCDFQIEKILSGTHVHYDWKKLRHEASSSFKVMNQALRLIREEQGKLSQPHHFSNEARLINWALTGQFSTLDRNSLSAADLDLLAKLELKNSVLISRALQYHDRKKILEQYAIDMRPAIALPPEYHPISDP